MSAVMYAAAGAVIVVALILVVSKIERDRKAQKLIEQQATVLADEWAAELDDGITLELAYGAPGNDAWDRAIVLVRLNGYPFRSETRDGTRYAVFTPKEPA